MMLVAVCVCFALAAVSAESGITLYKKVGDEVVLKLPSPPTNKLVNILWKHGLDLAIDWDGDGIESYRQFKVRGSLNISNGELTITGLTREDGGVYTPEVNSAITSSIRLIVISPVPIPTVNVTCEDETSCTLTCDGSSTDSEPATYTWRLGDIVLMGSANEQHITKEGYSSASEFSCELENPVSHEKSQPTANPFFTAEPPTPGNLKLSTGLTVLSCLLAAVLLLALIHRFKAGMWFFQKESMPWKADFWSNKDRQTNPAGEEAESKGTRTRLSNEQTDEVTPMTQTAKQDQDGASPL